MPPGVRRPQPGRNPPPPKLRLTRAQHSLPLPKGHPPCHATSTRRLHPATTPRPPTRVPPPRDTLPPPGGGAPPPPPTTGAPRHRPPPPHPRAPDAPAHPPPPTTPPRPPGDPTGRAPAGVTPGAGRGVEAIERGAHPPRIADTSAETTAAAKGTKTASATTATMTLNRHLHETTEKAEMPGTEGGKQSENSATAVT